MTENPPTLKYQAMKIMEMKSRPDTDFAIWRTFVDIAHGCTEEEATATPRWCTKPEIANEPDIVSNLLTGVQLIGGGAAGAVGAIGEATGLKDKSASNSA